MLRIAVQSKGRLYEDTLHLLTEADIKISSSKRTLLVQSTNFPLEVLYLRDDDIPQSVASGVADIGVVGENEFEERGEEADIVSRLGFSRCRLSLAIPKKEDYNGLEWFEGKKIATSYPNILRRFMEEKGIHIEIHVITGSVEEVYGKIRLQEDCGVRVYSRWIRLESDVPGREEALRVAGEARTLCGITDSGWADKVARLNAAGVHVQEEDVEVQYLAVGDGCLCGAPYELMVGFALETEKLLENEFFYANGYTNGNLLYFPTEEEFDAGGYEVFWSMLIYWPYVDRVYPFRRESASKLIRFMAENAPAGFDHSGRNVPD